MTRSIYPPLAVAAVSHDVAAREVVAGVVSRMQGVVFTGAFGSTAPVIEQAWVSHRNGHRDPWDVLLLDWSLPGADAAVCAQRLSALLRSPRIVALLAGDDPAEALAAVRAGAGAVLPRNLPPAALSARLEAVLSQWLSPNAKPRCIESGAASVAGAER